MNLAVFGDSHAQFCFDRILDAEIVWLGPVTMYRVGRDSAWFLDGWQLRHPGSDIVFIFGEIDVRCHVGRISDQTGISREKICADLAFNYLEAIVQHPALPCRHLVVCCVPPPADGAGLRNADFPVYGTWQDRANVTRHLNESLRRECASRNVLFLDFSADYSTPEGFLVPELSDGSVHIARRHAGAVVSKLEALLQRQLQVSTLLEIMSKAPQSSFGIDRPISSDHAPGHAGGWKRALFGWMPWSKRFVEKRVGGGKPGGFALHNCLAQGTARIVRQNPLRIGGAGEPWSYVASWENDLAICDAIGAGLRVELDVELIEGTAEAGLVAGDFSTFVHRVELGAGKQTVALEAQQALSVKALVLRSGGTGASTLIEVTGLRVQPIKPAIPRERGFLTKDAVDDLARKVGGAEIVIVDIGANRGDTVARFADRFPAAQVWAVEPHPGTFQGLQERFAQAGRIQLRNIALSGHNGSGVMHSYTNAAINSLSPVAAGAERLMDGAIVPTEIASIELQTLKAFCRRESIERIDILKLDTQGHEDEIISGSLDLLASGRVRYVLAELIFAPLYARQAKAGEVVALLEGCGFKIFDFYDFVYSDQSGLKWGDALFEFVGVQDGGSVAG